MTTTVASARVPHPVQPVPSTAARAVPSPSASSPTPGRFLSEADGRALLAWLARVAEGGGTTGLMLWSSWTGSLRWARNHVTTASDIRMDYIRVHRNLGGAQSAWLLVNDDSDQALVAAAREAERLAQLQPERPQAALYETHFADEPLSPTAPLFFDTTYQIDAEQRAAAAQHVMHTAQAAGMLSAGYLAVSAHSLAVLDTAGHARYCQYTTAQYSVTVRDPQGTGSGWAGVDWPDWTKIDGAQLSALALDKCLKSRNPVAIEPGRYTTILEPQAVCDFVAPMVQGDTLLQYYPTDRQPTLGPFGSHPPSYAALKGQRVIDPRLTLSADPTDPDLAFPPFNPMEAVAGQEEGFNLDYDVYHPVTWIAQGILRHLAYDRNFAIGKRGENLGLPNSGAFRLSGGSSGTTTVAEMIATTPRGLLVTRFDDVVALDDQSQLYRGYTRAGVWLIEHGAISKPVTNLVFTESVLFALNNVEQIGVPQRVFHPQEDSIRAIPQPVIVPALKIRDFSFTAMSAAI